MRRTRICLAICALSAAAVAHAYSQETNFSMTKRQQYQRASGGKDEAINNIKNMGKSYLNNKMASWLSRTDITYDLQEGNKPVGSIETIQPFYMNPRSTYFWQGRAAYGDTSTTLNFGLGYRYLTIDKQWLIGLNMFYDINIRFLHKRFGLGGEIFTPYVTFRANYYEALSQSQRVSSNTFQTAQDGYDFSAETPMPYVPWMRFTAQGYHWKGEKKSSVNGALINARMFPLSMLEVDAGIAYDNSKYRQAFIAANLYFDKPVFIEHTASGGTSNQPYTAQNLENMRLQKVIRKNDITVENNRAPVGINIGRGN